MTAHGTVGADRRGTSLLEIVCMLVPALLVLGLGFYLMSRLWFADAWNGARLSSVDGLLVAWEHLRTDLVSSRPESVSPGASRLQLEQGAPALSPCRVVYQGTAEGTLVRDGKRLATPRLESATFAWRDEGRGLLDVDLVSGGALESCGGNVPAVRARLAGTILVADRAARTDCPSWADR